VLNAAVARWPDMVGVGEGGLRSGVVHRLDVTTSGVLLLATDDERFAHLRAAFSGHAIDKTYHAIVRGDLSGSHREAMRLGITRHKPAHVTPLGADDPRGRPCRLAWHAVEPFGSATLVEVSLETGFLHQVRVMLAAIGHPLLGDAQYGDGEGADRPMLHAQAIRWGDIAAACDPPADFTQVLNGLRSA